MSMSLSPTYMSLSNYFVKKQFHSIRLLFQCSLGWVSKGFDQISLSYGVGFLTF